VDRSPSQLPGTSDMGGKNPKNMFGLFGIYSAMTYAFESLIK
jgi:hypothetical protein